MTEEETLWQRAILPTTATLQDAIQRLNDVAIKIVLIVRDDGVLQGTISDGDIRRGLLRGLTLASPIADVLRRNPLVVPEGMSRELVVQMMTANKIQQIPVVDADSRPVGLHLWSDMSEPARRPNLLVIMAGGLGTRLRPHTEDCPKPMLHVAGKPMLEHIIERAKGEGFDHFVLAIHYLGHMIEEYFGDGSAWQVHIEYVREEAPLGTAGALALLRPRPTLPLVVSNGDVLTDIRYGELLDFHCRHAAGATMAVRLHEWQLPFGVVRTRGVDIVGFEEKPISRSRINAGVYVLSAESLDAFQAGEHCTMPALFERLQERSVRTVVYPMHEPWIDAGDIHDLQRAQSHLSRTSV